MRKRNGSVMVGLIVCISVGVMGAGFLFPEIMRARQNAATIQCISNLKQIGIASFMYAADNRDYLPQWPEAGRSPLREGLRTFTSGSFYRADDLANYSPVVKGTADGVNDPGANILRLNISGYLGRWQRGSRSVNNVAQAAADARYLPIRFCPMLQAQSAEIARRFGSSYFYNPHWNYVTPRVWQDKLAEHPEAAKLNAIDPPVTIWYRKLSEYPRDAALAGDMMVDGQFIAHPTAWGKAQWNLLYPDGHVTSIEDGYVSSRLRGKGDGALWGDLTPAANAMDELRSLDDNLDVLETEVAGKNPLTETLLPPRTVDGKMPLRNREGEAVKARAVTYY